MDVQQKLKILQSVGEEITTVDELLSLLSSNKQLIAYDGFEPSGQIHIAQGLLRAININKITSCGITFKMLVADYHSLANNKLGGDLQKIQTVGKYFIEVWKACGLHMDHVEFIWASELARHKDYWLLVLKIARTNAIKRFIRTAEIMGREESMDLTLAQLIYPAMQIADIFMLGATIAQLGMDQRKVNMLAREIGLQLPIPFGGWKPVIVSHHMLMGLTPPLSTAHTDSVSKSIAQKMSKSNPMSAIFMTDTTNDVENKIQKAYCKEAVVENNPILEYCKYIIFEAFDRLGCNSFTIIRPEKFGGDISFANYIDLEKAYKNKELHPVDLKIAVAQAINKLLDPVRKHFDTNTKAKQLLKTVQSYQITR